ncbi:MAG: hypothetical protein HFE59_06750 [Clostridiales bacterium]|nr:hypothetical protein [Clostridiales bacterium]
MSENDSSNNENLNKGSQENGDQVNQVNSPQNGGKSNKGVIIALAAVIAVLVIGGGAFGMWMLYNKDSGYDPNATVGIKKDANIFFDDNSKEEEEYLKNRVNNINVTINTVVSTRKTEDGKVMALVNLNNKNDFQYKVDFLITNEEGNKLIAETGLVPAGAKVPEVEIKEELAPGTYEVSAIFYAISAEDNQTDLGSVGTVITLKI